MSKTRADYYTAKATYDVTVRVEVDENGDEHTSLLRAIDALENGDGNINDDAVFSDLKFQFTES